MKNRSFVPSLAVVLAAALLPIACNKDSSAGRAAGISASPVQAAAPAPPTAPPPAPTDNAPPPAAPAMQQALNQALNQALGTASANPGAAGAVEDVVDAQHSINGTIVLPATNRSKVARGDVIFLAARRAGGPPGPGAMLAVQKLTAGDFPMPFTLSSRDAMIPGIPFEGQMSITARVDKDGDAMTRRKGDVFGLAPGVKVGAQKVVIHLDQIQADDQSLGGQVAGPAGPLPPGHP